MDIRLKELPFVFDDKDFILRCNMNVLADVQEAFDGDFSSALDGKKSVLSVITFLTAMLNDYADEKGWAERYNVKQVGRMFQPLELRKLREQVMGLVASALTDDDEEQEEIEEKNVHARQD